MYRVSRRAFMLCVRPSYSAQRMVSGPDEEFVTVASGVNEGYKVRTNLKNRNPRNLEMMNIAHRDMGWAAGPHNTASRFVKYYESVGHDRTGMRHALTNLPAHNSYNAVEIIRKEKCIEGICRHFSGEVIAMASSNEGAMSNQLLSNTDRIAAYFVGLVLGGRMHMAGITNCTYPFLPSDHSSELDEHEDNFLAGLDETGISLEEEISETSIWNQVKFTNRSDEEIQTYTRGQTPSQIKNNKGSMFD